MPLKEALHLCPDAKQVPSDFAETAIASQQIESIVQSHAAVIEQYSIDEWFMDLRSCVGGVPFDLLLWAQDLQKEIMEGTGLSVSIGVGPSKILAKMAGEEHKPAGVTIIEKHEIEAFLSRRSAPAIPGIGNRRSVYAQAKNWHTAWDIAAADESVLRQLFGKPGTDLKRELLGEILSKVASDDEPPKTISRTRSFKASADRKIIWAHLMQHISYIVLKMRTQDLAARGISVWLRDAHFSHDGMQLRLPQAMDTEEDITPFARKAFDQMFHPTGRYTQVGFCLWGLGPKVAAQFSLFESPLRAISDEALQGSLDSLRKRFGREVVIRGSQLPIHPHQRLRGQTNGTKEYLFYLPFFE